MSVNEITNIIFVAMFCFYLIGSVVTLILAYINNKRLLDYLRHIIKIKESEVFEQSGEVKQ